MSSQDNGLTFREILEQIKQEDDFDLSENTSDEEDKGSNEEEEEWSDKHMIHGSISSHCELNEMSNAQNGTHYNEPKWCSKSKIQPHSLDNFPPPNYSIYAGKTPTELFELFFDTEVWDLLLRETQNYANSEGGGSFTLTEEDLKVFVGIFVTSGLIPVASHRHFWRNSNLIRNTAISNAMRRDRFEKIIKYLHFTDSSSVDPFDKYAKIRPLLTLIEERFMANFIPEPILCHDEAMIEIFGRNACRQCIKDKHIRFGYRVWCLNTHDGYCINFNLVQRQITEGINTQYEQGFGKNGASVLRNLDALPSDKRNLPYNIYFDDRFTSFPLLKELSDRNYGATGAIREGLCAKCPLRSVSDMKNEDFGSCDSVTDIANNIAVTRWNENSVCTIASTAHGYDISSSGKSAKRYSQTLKKVFEVDVPELIYKYSAHIIGTDRQNQNIKRHRISFRGKHWWWSIFTWILDLSLQNAWILHQKSGGKAGQFEFLENVAETYISKFGTPPKTIGRPKASSFASCKRVNDDVRFDGYCHYLIENPRRKRRRCAGIGCKSVCLTQCKKCDVGLCLHCNYAFHTNQ